MSARDYESVIAALKAQVADLEERVAELEQRAGKHSCAVDLCSTDAYGNCLLKPAGDVWGAWPSDSYPWGDDEADEA